MLRFLATGQLAPLSVYLAPVYATRDHGFGMQPNELPTDRCREWFVGRLPGLRTGQKGTPK